MRTVFMSNLKNFLQSNNITQTQFAKSLGVSNASISNYLSGASEPTLSFFLKLKSTYNLSLDNFLTTTIIPHIDQNLSTQNISRFIGNYIIYYYDASSYIGQASNSQKDVLKYGIISIIPSGNTLISYGCFLKDYDKAIELKNKLDERQNPFDQYEIFSSYTDFVYTGKIENSSTQIFIFIKSFNDSCLIILNNPPSNKTYIGGLGTVNSVSRGREHMPCIQFVLLSRKPLCLPEGEIYNLLALDVVNINVHNETDSLLELFKNLYLHLNDNELKLEDYQKRKIFEDALEHVVADCVESNIFRFAKISAKEDDQYYNLIKDQD